MSPWGWMPERTQGVWHHGALWLRPVAMVSPCVSVLVCLATMFVVGGTLTASKGVLFDIPEGEVSDVETASLVVLAMPVKNETALFIDDVRYLLDDGFSSVALGDRIAGIVSQRKDCTMLVLADRRIPCGDLSRLAGIARKSGIRRILFANKRGDRTE